MMPSQEDIERLQQLLEFHRATLAHYLRQQALYGRALSPPSVIHGIAEARAEIADIKATLRSWGVPVEDHPDDAEYQSAATPASTLSPSATVLPYPRKRNLLVFVTPLFLVIILGLLATILTIPRLITLTSVTPTLLIPTFISTPFPIATTTPSSQATSITPSPIPPTATPTFRELAEQEFKRLDTGISLFNPPTRMEVGQSVVIRYRLGFGTTILTPTLAAGMLSGAATTIITNTQVKISSRMIATLTGEKDAFDIVPVDANGERLVLSDVVNEWTWNVTAKQRGPHKLTFQLIALIEVGENAYRFPFPVDEKEVVVDINWMRSAQTFVSDNWRSFLAWLLPSSVGAAIGAWLWRRIRGRRAAGNEQAEQAASSDASGHQPPVTPQNDTLQERAVAEQPPAAVAPQSSTSSSADMSKKPNEPKKKTKRNQ